MQRAPRLLWKLSGHQGQSGSCAGVQGTLLSCIQAALTFFELLAWGVGGNGERWSGQEEEEWLERGWGKELERDLGTGFVEITAHLEDF